MLMKTLVPLSIVVITVLMLLFAVWMSKVVRGGREDGPVAVPQSPAVVAFTPPEAPIEMRLSFETPGGSLSLAIGMLALTVWLATTPGWMRLLAWPAAALVLLFVVVGAWSVWSELRTRVVADANGMHVHDGDIVKKIPWSRVAEVKRVEHWAAKYRGLSRLKYTDFVFLDQNAAELIKLRVPLRPAEASEAFVASVPVWTQRPITLVQEGK